MAKFDAVQVWMHNVAYSHSGSKQTACNYPTFLMRFCDFIGCTPQQILDEYEESDEKVFKRKYARLLRAYIASLVNEGYALGSVTTMTTPVKSFFKYNDLPLGYVPTPQTKITYHNRDIDKREIVEVLRISSPRNRAFYCMMAKTGQGPGRLCNLRRKHIEPDFTKGIIPCMIKVPEELAKGEFGAYFSFMDDEAVRHLKTYFKKRGIVGPEDYIFTKQGTDEQLSSKSISGLFTKALEELKETGVLKFEQVKQGKPRELRLYCLRKFFRNNNQAGVDYKNFWMGHRADYKAPHIPRSDEHYFSREDIEFQREVYREHAMPYLRLETATPGEMEQTVIELRRQIDDLEKSLQRRDTLALRALELLDNPKVRGFLERKAQE